MMPILFGQVCLNGWSVRGGSFGEPPRLFFRGRKPKEKGTEKEGREKGCGKRREKAKVKKAGRLQSGKLRTGRLRTERLLTGQSRTGPRRTGRGGQGDRCFPEKFFGNTLAKKTDFGYNKKKATGVLSGGRSRNPKDGGGKRAGTCGGTMPGFAEENDPGFAVELPRRRRP